MSFKQFRQQFQTNATKIVTGQHLFKLDIDTDELWQQYLTGFDNYKIRQEHNCNCCRRFFRDYGSLVVIDKYYKIVTLWDFSCEEEFQQSAINVNNYLSGLKIKQTFFSPVGSLGTDRTPTMSGYWDHLNLDLVSFSTTSKSIIGECINATTTAKTVLLRAITEINPEAVNTVLSLISENNLYKGAEFNSNVQALQKAQSGYYSLPEDCRDNFVWLESKNLGLAHIRNSVIGTLLTDLSENDDIESAVKAYEFKVAPTNYQRPKALVTESMLKSAKKTLTELGLEESIYRKFAQPTDLDVNNLLFVDRTTSFGDIFDRVKADLNVDVTKLTNLKEISLEEFVTSTLIDQKSLSILLENKHEGNLFSLINACYQDSPSLFKWDNQFSWSYHNGLADSIRDRVTKAGGIVSGLLRVSLAWDTNTDLDLAIYESDGNRIYYANATSTKTKGKLDVDAQAHTIVSNPVENIIYPHDAKLPDGEYRIVVNNYNDRVITDNFTVEIEFGGNIFTYHHNVRIRNKENVSIGSVLVKGGVLQYKGSGESKMVNKEMWGLNTNRFHKVLAMFNSPNYWGNNSLGNKHVLFHLEGANNDGIVNPFFNEQLKSVLTQRHKRVFEVLASKIKVENTRPQVSGLGFSTTSDGSFICKLDNNKTIKVIVGNKT